VAAGWSFNPTTRTLYSEEPGSLSPNVAMKIAVRFPEKEAAY
jgi:hypothetical protein